MRYINVITLEHFVHMSIMDWQKKELVWSSVMLEPLRVNTFLLARITGSTCVTVPLASMVQTAPLGAIRCLKGQSCPCGPIRNVII